MQSKTFFALNVKEVRKWWSRSRTPKTINYDQLLKQLFLLPLQSSFSVSTLHHHQEERLCVSESLTQEEWHGSHKRMAEKCLLHIKFPVYYLYSECLSHRLAPLFLSSHLIIHSNHPLHRYEACFEYISWDFLLLASLLPCHTHFILSSSSSANNSNISSSSSSNIILYHNTHTFHMWMKWKTLEEVRIFYPRLLTKHKRKSEKKSEFFGRSWVEMRKNVWWLPWVIQGNSFTKLKINLLYIMLGILSLLHNIRTWK